MLLSFPLSVHLALMGMPESGRTQTDRSVESETRLTTKNLPTFDRKTGRRRTRGEGDKSWTRFHEEDPQPKKKRETGDKESASKEREKDKHTHVRNTGMSTRLA